MAAVSILGPGGYPKSPYGSFANKPTRMFTQQFTVLGPMGVPRPPYGSFTSKTGGKTFTQIFTVLGAQGVPRPPYGSFAAKVSGTPTEIHFQPIINGYIGRMWTR